LCKKCPKWPPTVLTRILIYFLLHA